MAKDVHVVRESGGWEVRGEGASRAQSVHPTQAEAVAAARRHALTSGGAEVVVHRADGRIRNRQTVGASVVNEDRDRKPRAPRSKGPRTTLRVPAELAAVADRLASELGISRNDALLRLATTGAEIFEEEEVIATRRAQRWNAIEPGSVADVDPRNLPGAEEARKAVLDAR